MTIRLEVTYEGSPSFSNDPKNPDIIVRKAVGKTEVGSGSEFEGRDLGFHFASYEKASEAGIKAIKALNKAGYESRFTIFRY
jgi:hypothetical protein